LSTGVGKLADVMVQQALKNAANQVTQALLTAALTGNKPQIDFDALLKSSVQAGVLAGVNVKLDQKLGFVDPKTMSFTDKLSQVSLHAVTQTGVMGGDFAENLKANLTDALGAKAAGLIGDNKAAWGDIGHKAAHAALGCALAAARQGDCSAGAIGAVAAEVAAELSGLGEIKNEEQRTRSVLLLGQLSALSAAALTNQEDLAGAMDTANNAVLNNFLTHVQQGEMAKALTDCAKNVNPEQCRQKVYANWKLESDKNNQTLSNLYEECDKNPDRCGALASFIDEGIADGDKAYYRQLYGQMREYDKTHPYQGKVPTYEQLLAGMLMQRSLQGEVINAHQASSTWVGDTYVSRQDYYNNPLYQSLTGVKQIAEVPAWLGMASAMVGPSRSVGLVVGKKLATGEKALDGAGDYKKNIPATIEYTLDRNIISQGNKNVCGPTCCCMIINDKYGNQVSLESVINQFDEVRPTGVNIHDISKVLTKNAISHQAETDLQPAALQTALSQNETVILHVKAGQGGHFIIVDGIKEVNGVSYYMTRDPSPNVLNNSRGVRVDILEKYMTGNAVLVK
jgi:filamentous hemagglutinin